MTFTAYLSFLDLNYCTHTLSIHFTPECYFQLKLKLIP